VRQLDRDAARAALIFSHQAARQTRATTRGNVDSVNSDGSAIVTLRSGAKVKVYSSNLFEFSKDESLTLVQRGGLYEALGPSGYQGGLGSPYDPGE
jgi:hypothetical protein